MGCYRVYTNYLKIFSVLLMLLVLVPGGYLAGDILFSPAATVELARREIISIQQLEQRVKQLEALQTQSGLGGRPIDRERVLESMIAEVLIKQGARRSGVTVSTTDMQRFMQNQKRGVEMQIGTQLNDRQFRELVARETGLTWNEYEEQIREQLIQQTYITQKKSHLFDSIRPPSEREIVSVYRDNATMFTNPEIIRMSHIFIPTVNKSSTEREAAKTRIEEAYRILRQGGARFDDLVLRYSEDDETKFRGGDVGYISRNDQRIRSSFGSTFFEEIFSLEHRQTSAVLRSNLGYHIVRVTEHHKPRILDLTDPVEPGSRLTVKEYISNVLMQEKQQQVLEKALDEIVTQLKAEAEIRILIR